MCSSVLVSCNKDDDDKGENAGVNSSKHVVKRYYEWSNTLGEMTYTYDDKGRVIKLNETEKSPNGVLTSDFTYTYGDMLIISNEIQSYNGSSKNYTINYHIENGLIVKDVEYGSKSSILSEHQYTYDSDRHLVSIECKYKDHSTTKRYFWTNGNLTSYTDTDSRTHIISYSKVPWMDGFFRFELDPVFQSLGYWGKMPVTMPSAYQEYVYDYTLSDGVITKVVETSTESNFKNIESFIWE